MSDLKYLFCHQIVAILREAGGPVDRLEVIKWSLATDLGKDVPGREMHRAWGEAVRLCRGRGILTEDGGQWSLGSVPAAYKDTPEAILSPVKEAATRFDRAAGTFREIGGGT